jgi:hypothetical protein
MNYRYRLWGIRWWPVAFSAGLTALLVNHLTSSWIAAVAVLLTYLFVQISLIMGYFLVRQALLILYAVSFFYLIISATLFHDWVRFLLAVGFGVQAYALDLWLQNCLGSAAVNPYRNWVQGRLSGLPHLQAVLVLADGGRVDAAVRSLDERGLFLLIPPSVTIKKVSELPKKVDFQLSFKGETFSGEGRRVAWLWREQWGIGLQFLPTNLYHQGNYTRLVQKVKGEGIA